MPVPKVPPPKIARSVDDVHWSMSGDDADATLEARRRARLAAPDAVAFLVHCIRDDHASNQQRVRSANMVLECAGLLQTESKPTGLFGSDAGDADGAGAGEPR
jgi:hypothetical protein